MPFSHLLLLEITLTDHYEKYMSKKYPDMSYDEYERIAAFDPTTKNGQRGKYVEWLLKMYDVGDNRLYFNTSTYSEIFQDYLLRYAKFTGKKLDINSFKNIGEFNSWVDFNIPEESNKEKKAKEKEIFNRSEDIKIIDVSEDWIIAQPLTQEGNILLARYKSDESAKWCTADPSYTGHWKNYTRNGDLICFLSKHDPEEKYQIHVVDGKIEESRDFNDNESDTPADIIADSENFDKNYGKLKQKEPPVLQLDSYNIADYYLSDNFDEFYYLSRTLTDREMEEYGYGNNDIEYNIGRYDRILENGFDDYWKREYKKDDAYGEFQSRMENFVGFFGNTFLDGEGLNYVSTDHSGESTEAVYDYFHKLENEYDEFKMEYEEDNGKPQDTDYTYEDDIKNWTAKLLKGFNDNYEAQIAYVQFFRDNGFEYTFAWEKDAGEASFDDPRQLKLPFEESILQKFKHML
jgi:hypothetical protein